jgi:hypothetical protein
MELLLEPVMEKGRAKHWGDFGHGPIGTGHEPFERALKVH